MAAVSRVLTGRLPLSWLAASFGRARPVFARACSRDQSVQAPGNGIPAIAAERSSEFNTWCARHDSSKMRVGLLLNTPICRQSAAVSAFLAVR
jgi:hypothetical protein